MKRGRVGEEGVTTSSCQGTDRLQPHGVSRQHGSGASPSVFFPNLPWLVHIRYRIRKRGDVCLEPTKQMSNCLCAFLCLWKKRFFLCKYDIQCGACMSTIINFVGV